jgi:hypothetical protein
LPAQSSAIPERNSNFAGVKIRLLSALFFIWGILTAQTRLTTVGLQFKPIISGEFFETGPLTNTEGAVDFTITPTNGYGFGMVIRRGFNEQFSLEAGINYTKRNYDLTIAVDSLDFSGTSDFSYVIYEIPVLGLLYVRLGENTYLNNAFGINFNFLPSDWESFDTYFRHRSYRESWMIPALQANVGFEYRTYESGFFYLGFSFHRPFANLTRAGVAYRENQQDQEITYFDIPGNYLTMDIRYFFHEEPERKFKR